MARGAQSEASSRSRHAKNAPKRALSAYMFFSQDWRERVKAQNSSATLGEISKILGTKWKELSEEDKKPYIERAAKDKQRYEAELEAYDSKYAGTEEDESD